MAVEVYICKKFEQGHERAAFGRFLQEMLDRYTKSEDLYVVVVEPEVNTASMDLVVITNRALIIVELKELTYAEGVDISEIALVASETNPWEYTPQGRSSYRMGGAGSRRNPYKQIEDHKYKLREWILDHPIQFGGKRLNHETVKRVIYSWDVISPGFNKALSTLDLPWREIESWYKILSLPQLAWEIDLATNQELRITDEEKRCLARQMGGVFQENLSEFVPNYVPPVPRITFFSRPPLSKLTIDIDRQVERTKLQNFLDKEYTAFLYLGGVGGLGKSHLATWLCTEADRKGYKHLWIDCGDRDVSIEAFLTALAAQMPDKYQAAIIYGQEQKLVDKFDVAIEFLEGQKYLVIFDDYHKILPTNTKKIEDFFTRALQRSASLKLVVTTRTRPDYLDQPDLPPNGLVEVPLSGLPAIFVPQYIQSISPKFSFPDTEISQIWERTAGNPYAIRLMLTILRTKGGHINPSALPIFNDEQGRKWADSLLQTLTGDLKSLAMKLSVIPGTMDRRLIERMSYASSEKAATWIRGLVDQYILTETGPDLYQIQDYMREALYSITPEKDKQKAHATAGSYFESTAAETKAGSTEPLLQAVIHYDKAERHDETLRVVSGIHDLLQRQGDLERALSTASVAAKAAKSKNNPEQYVYWLTQQMNCHLSLQLNVADLIHPLKDVFDVIEKHTGSKKIKEAELLKWKALEADVWIVKGRIAAAQYEHDTAIEYLTKSLELAEKSGEKKNIANSLLKVAQQERYQGKYSEAKEHLTQAGDLLRKLGDEVSLSNCLSQLGLIARSSGDLDEAKRLFELAHKKASECEDISGAEIYLSLLGDIALRRQDYLQAETIFDERLTRVKRIGNRQATRITLGWLFDAKLGQNDLRSAAELLQEYEKLCNESNDEIGIAWSYARRGRLEHANNNIEAGNALIEQAIEKVRNIGQMNYIKDLQMYIKH